MSSLFNISSLHPSIYFIFTAAAAKPTPLALFSPTAFKIGDIVQPTPDTTPGVHPSQSVSVAGNVSKLKVDGGWCYNISSIYHFHPLTLPFARPRYLKTVWPGKELRKRHIDRTYCSSALFRILFIYCFYFFLFFLFFSFIFHTSFSFSPSF